MPSAEQYKAARDKVAAAKKEAQEMVKSVFREESRSVLDELGIESFGWTQYTPYFNDGDACVFSAHTDADSVYVNGVNSYKESVWGDEDEDEETEDTGRPPYPSWEMKKENPDEYEKQLAAHYGKHGVVASFLRRYDEEDLEFMFGDHVVITITRDDIEVETYDHD